MTFALSRPPTLLAAAAAYFLVIHGSRDPRPQLGLEQLAQTLRDRLSQLDPLATPLVGTGCLELGPTSLDQQLCQFGELALQQGVRQVQVLPLFLLPGKHVVTDLPAAIALAHQALPVSLELNLRPYLGSHPHLGQLLTRRVLASNLATWILVSHGSRHPQGNQPLEALAQNLKAHPAYWLVTPDLATQVQTLVRAGHTQIGILPYFLFAGSITDAIAQQVQQLQHQWPQIDLQLLPVLNTSLELIDLILDLTQTPLSFATAL